MNIHLPFTWIDGNVISSSKLKNLCLIKKRFKQSNKFSGFYNLIKGTKGPFLPYFKGILTMILKYCIMSITDMQDSQVSKLNTKQRSKNARRIKRFDS